MTRRAIDGRRRAIVRALGVTAAAAGFGGVAAGQDDGDETDDGDEQLPIVLGGEATQWVGLTPNAIQGEANPTLDLEAGQEYELAWINLDGVEHQLVIEDEGGEELERGEESETAGEVVSMTFEATEEMTEYYCEYHPEDMRGDVELGGGFDLSAYGHDDEGDGEGDGNGNGDGDGEDEDEDGSATDDTGY